MKKSANESIVWDQTETIGDYGVFYVRGLTVCTSAPPSGLYRSTCGLFLLLFLFFFGEGNTSLPHQYLTYMSFSGICLESVGTEMSTFEWSLSILTLGVDQTYAKMWTCAETLTWGQSQHHGWRRNDQTNSFSGLVKRSNDCSAWFRQPVDGPQMTGHSVLQCTDEEWHLLDTCDIWAINYIGLAFSAQRCPPGSSFELLLWVHVNLQRKKMQIWDLRCSYNSQSRCQYLRTSLSDLFQSCCFVFFPCTCFYISSRTGWQQSISKTRECAINHCGHGGLHLDRHAQLCMQSTVNNLYFRFRFFFSSFIASASNFFSGLKTWTNVLFLLK